MAKQTGADFAALEENTRGFANRQWTVPPPIDWHRLFS
jgi:hypothetical protein